MKTVVYEIKAKGLATETTSYKEMCHLKEKYGATVTTKYVPIAEDTLTDNDRKRIKILANRK